jgi:hypothetical protein
MAPKQWAIAAEWNKRWQAVRKGDAPPLVNLDQLSREQAEAARRYPPGSVGAAFQVYIRTPEWTARAYSARTKIWWPAWFRRSAAAKRQAAYRERRKASRDVTCDVFPVRATSRRTI